MSHSTNYSAAVNIHYIKNIHITSFTALKMFEVERIVNNNFIWFILTHIVLGLVAFLLLAVYFLRKDPRINRHLRELGGPPSLPIVGSALSLLGPHENIIGILLGWVKLYGHSFGVWIGNAPYAFLGNPHHVEKILSSNIHVNKGQDYGTYLEAWLGTGLLTARRDKWFHRRKLLTPTFHFKILEDFVPIFNEQAKIMNVLLERQRQQNDSFDITPFISRCTLDVICETAMGAKLNSQIGGEAEYVNIVCGMTDILLQKAMNPMYRIPLIWNIAGWGKLEAQYLKALHDFTDKMIRDRRAERKRKELIASASEVLGRRPSECDNSEQQEGVGVKTRKAFLDLLLDLQESEKNLTDADIREEVDTFMFEGHDTTGANLDWALLLLANNPECQRKVHEELDSVFAGDMDRDITTSDLKQLKYLECCVKETLRLYPSVPFFLRKAEQDIPLDEKGLIIPKGCSIMVSSYIAHRYPSIFPDPERFDPERFTPENSAGRHPYSYVPFSAGPRNCIGQKFAQYEEKIVLATLLRKFRVEAIDKREETAMVPDVILRPKYGIRVKLINRALEAHA